MAPADNALELEKKSCAVTLSDMEVFIFPELIYSLMLANIMSPCLWRWREDPWFAGLERMKPSRRIARLKQFIMDHYAFNLDLDTWGLTTKERELERFKAFIAPETLAQSNALFGYEGDKYYFDIDIRTHFGLDKYAGSVIPYWKTETVEAMDAFRFKPNYATGAGECVSLAALYAAALFVVAGIPLRDIFLMATPLHSQNFVDLDDGILTNNRRLVSKTMWFNGTALSAQARRALEHERVTLVAHESGVIHAIYDEASIDPTAYARFSAKLAAFLKTELNGEILGNFLRDRNEIQRCFQVRWRLHEVDHYAPIERILAYEHGSPYRLTDGTRAKLMEEVESEEFCSQPIKGRIILNDLEAFIERNHTDMDDPADVVRLKAEFASECLNADCAIESLLRFCHVRPRLPDPAARTFVAAAEPLGVDQGMTREEIVERLDALRATNAMARYAFYAYRDLLRTEPGPFLRAAMQRNPVGVGASAGLEEAALAARIAGFAETSIYDDPGRLAQPDEVWNFERGDGLEKALLLANVLQAREPGLALRLVIAGGTALLQAGERRYTFVTGKGLPDQVWELSAAAAGPR